MIVLPGPQPPLFAFTHTGFWILLYFYLGFAREGVGLDFDFSRRKGKDRRRGEVGRTKCEFRATQGAALQAPFG